MKKFTYLVIATAALSIAACTGQKNGYVITGTAEGAADGDTVYLQERTGRNLTKLDTAIISNGKFTFEGVQDSAINRYVTYKNGTEPLMVDFFLENGKINIALGSEKSTATGTSNNNAYQEIKNKIDELNAKMNAIYKAMSDTTLSEEQKAAKQEEGAQIEEEFNKVIKEGVEKNITNPVGIFMFKQTFMENTTAENDALLQKIPVNFQNDATIVQIKELIDKQKKTAVGTKFIDFEMQNPEGKTVKLSDYTGKGKVVLVDFWASWCGPCRREMPNLVETYAKYKNKNFEIVGVSLDQDEAAWKEAIKKMDMTWPQMSDLKFWQSEGAQLYAVNSIPHTILIDENGTIVARGLHGEELQTKIAEFVK
ncbi:TlpA disulfide reductase family protein [Bacteroides faecalis]|uniref:Thiol:disulfide interchange protein n=1 Tax=Bacteroides faecalis TaxID=2447885 RepID=A0A401LQV0_9BACE|nr:TlpA disulfide reductase family protein [Bacteroides faecalis]GCB33925.1 thiol:disulfide interchange protein [Bacteroides faecalis]